MTGKTILREGKVAGFHVLVVEKKVTHLHSRDGKGNHLTIGGYVKKGGERREGIPRL